MLCGDSVSVEDVVEERGKREVSLSKQHTPASESEKRRK
jgi:hypothetical protein